MLLAIDTCSNQCSVALANDTQVIASRVCSTTRHAERLLSLIDELLQAKQYSIDEVTRYAVTNGPGTFTGVRTGLSVVTGLALPTEAEIAVTSSLAVLAHQSAAIRESAFHYTALDARMGELYFASWQQSDHSLLNTTPPTVIAPANLPVPLESSSVAFIGTGWQTHWAALPSRLTNERCAPSEQAPHASTLAEMVLNHSPHLKWCQVNSLTACYVRDQVATPK